MCNITQEMILAAKNAGNNVSALVAVYPLILEQAAKVCEDKADENDLTDGGWIHYTSMRCAQAIRNLKDKTDEADNG